MGRGWVGIHNVIRRFCTLWFWRYKNLANSTTSQEQSNKGRLMRCIIYNPHWLRTNLSLGVMSVSIYLHWRGAFGVARFDLSGNARAFIAWNEWQNRLRAFSYVLMSGFRQQRSRLALFVNGLLMNILQNNPYRMLGVYSNSPTRERLANCNRMKAFLKVGKPVAFPLDLPN